MLQAIDSGNISEHQLSELIKLSRAIIQGHLSFLRSSIMSMCVRQGLTLTDLAYDCIAEAFGRDAGNRFYKLQKFIASIDGTLKTIPDHGLFLAYKGFLRRFTEAQLARLYAQMDPTGSHVHRNFREALRKSRYFVLERDHRGLCLVLRDSDAFDHLEQFPNDELALNLLPAISSHSSIPHVLEVLHGILSDQNTYRRRIPLLEIVWLVKGVFQSEYDPEVSVEHPWSLEGLTEDDLEQVQCDVENALKERILLTYLVKGKVSDEEARGMFNALQDIMDEWFAGRASSEPIYVKLGRHLQLDQTTYELEYRAKMEYLYRLAREEVASRLMREL
jgi:hypothetical protein